MKLSSLSPEQKTQLLAELDGKLHPVKGLLETGNPKHPFMWWDTDWIWLPNYLTSYDAIIPLIQKLFSYNLDGLQKFMFALCKIRNCSGPDSNDRFHYLCAWAMLIATPSQLCDAVIVASDVFGELKSISGLKNYSENGEDFLVEDAYLKDGAVKIHWRY